jgi:hypothetical protein
VKKVKLTPKEVRAYELASGFETTGSVEIHITDDNEVWALFMSLIQPK